MEGGDQKLSNWCLSNKMEIGNGFKFQFVNSVEEAWEEATIHR